MRYENTVIGTFVCRPNRFIAFVNIDGTVTECHVKNTGRCHEILVEGSKVILQKSDNPERKTKYDIISVYKGNRLINIDSQVPNTVVAESLPSLGIIDNIGSIKREVKYGGSRFDIFVDGPKKTFVEVKGVTLEKDGIALFPDAPTERGVKHVRELMDCVQNGYSAILFLLIQMSDVSYFTPNYKTHEVFGDILKKASENGVRVIAYDSIVTESSIDIGNPVQIRFKEQCL